MVILERLKTPIFFLPSCLSVRHRTILYTSEEEKMISLKSNYNQQHPSLLHPQSHPQHHNRLTAFQAHQRLRTNLSHPSFWLPTFPICPWNMHTCSSSSHFQPSSKLKKPIPSSRSLSFLTVTVLSSSLWITRIMHTMGFAKCSEWTNVMLSVHWKQTAQLRCH